MKRVAQTELLDTDSGTPAEIAASLSDLKRINRWFGGVATTRRMLDRIAHGSQRPFSLLEVAAGNGWVPQAAAATMQKPGRPIEITLLDRVPRHLNDGTGSSSRSVAADALALPFADGSFDFVSSCLFVHHLAPEQLVAFVNEALRVCRQAVLINDLVRSRLHLALTYAGCPLFRSRLTWHDAPASVRQAYTAEEMHAWLQHTRSVRTEIRRHYLFRMSVIAWKHPDHA